MKRTRGDNLNGDNGGSDDNGANDDNGDNVHELTWKDTCLPTDELDQQQQQQGESKRLKVADDDKDIKQQQQQLIGLIWYKFRHEENKKVVFRCIPGGNRQWHDIKHDLDEKHGINKMKQAKTSTKKSNNSQSMFIAIKFDKWVNQKVTSHLQLLDILINMHVKPEDNIATDEKLIIVRVPKIIGSKFYNDVAPVLKFEATMTEEEKLALLLGETTSITNSINNNYEHHKKRYCGVCGSFEHTRFNCPSRKITPKGIPKTFLDSGGAANNSLSNNNNNTEMVNEQGQQVIWRIDNENTTNAFKRFQSTK